MANNLWVGAVRKGLAADKPTIPDFPDETFGFYFETDTGILNFGIAGGAVWETMIAPSGAITGGATPETGVTAAYAPLGVQKMTLTLADIEVAVADADDYGSAALVTLPDKNLIVIGCEVDLELVKDGTGFINTTDLDVALGTSAASNTTLSAGMINILPKVDLDASDLSPALDSHSLATTPVLTGVQDGAANKVYLNIAGATETSENATVTATGTVEIYFIDVGNTTS